jgi:hypothetical protein
VKSVQSCAAITQTLRWQAPLWRLSAALAGRQADGTAQAPAGVRHCTQHKQWADGAVAEVEHSTADGALLTWPMLALPSPLAQQLRRRTCQLTGAAPARMQQHCRALCRIFEAHMRHSSKPRHPIGRKLTNSLCRTVPEGYTVLREGKGAILRKGNDVFYNPAQARSLMSAALHVASVRGVMCSSVHTSPSHGVHRRHR